MEFRPGFRISRTDIAALCIGAIALTLAIVQEWRIAFAIGSVVLHFFMFCNVFRIARAFELIWMFSFIALETRMPWTLDRSMRSISIERREVEDSVLIR